MILSCPFCGVKVTPSDKSCPKCARPMSRRCPSCAEDIAANAPQCKYCGEDLKGGSAPLRVAGPRPDIEFIEETKTTAPAKRKCCGRAKILALLLLGGLVFSAHAVRADCVACSKRPEHEVCVTTKTSASHCERRFCKNGKTPLWVTVYESLGGHVTSCKRKECKKAPSPEVSAPVPAKSQD